MGSAALRRRHDARAFGKIEDGRSDGKSTPFLAAEFQVRLEGTGTWQLLALPIAARSSERGKALAQAYAVHILDVYDHYRCRAWPVKNKMGGGEPVFCGHIDTDDNWLARYPVPIID